MPLVFKIQDPLYTITSVFTRIIIYNGHREKSLVLAGHYFLKLSLVMAVKSKLAYQLSCLYWMTPNCQPNLRPGGRSSLSNSLDVPLRNLEESRLTPSGRYKVAVINNNACISTSTL